MIPSVVARQLRETVLDYLRTTFALSEETFEEELFNFLDGPDGLFRGPYIDIRTPFRKATAQERIPLDVRPDFNPYRHQLTAFRRLFSKDGHQPQHTLVTTGTGSGKTECFLYPILDHCWRNRGTPGVKAIILYPMNALASDQARRIAKILWSDERLRGQVSAGLYVGGDGHHGVADQEHLVDKREILRSSPPDILLTNYKMLDFLLLRPEDRKLWAGNNPSTLRYLVLDELHTYDGAQGSDVACLIRRLKNRLNSAPGSLCCVGTSATIGDASEASAKALTDFASQIFDEDFFDESLVTEDRLSVAETFPGPADLLDIPTSAEDSKTDPAQFSGDDSWLSAQVSLWFGAEHPVEPLAVAHSLSRHDFLRDILRVLDRRVRTLQELDEGLSRRLPEWAEMALGRRHRLLNSFLGLVSYARRLEDGLTLPFLALQMQLWIRELRHLLRGVTNPAGGLAFGWASDRLDGYVNDAFWLPIAYCRECGQSGFAACQREGEARLESNKASIGAAWLRRSNTARYLRLGEQEGDLFPAFVDPSTLVIGSADDVSEGEVDSATPIPVRICADVSTEAPPRFLARCPDCGADGALSILGARAPSLLSVLISDTFSSPYNEDKKLLAFTDSVQDASHRAGFFGARTYRFNVRTAMQAVLEATDESLPLVSFGEVLLAHWGGRIEQPKLIATLLPSDLVELPDYQRFRNQQGAGEYRRLLADLAERLSWEVTMEYGLRSRVGRTLEATRCSTVSVRADRLEESVEKLTLILEEEGVFEGPHGKLSDSQVRHFLRGLVHRLRVRGGIDHPFLKRYIETGGKWFELTKGRQRLISPFGRYSVLPRLLIDRPRAGGAAGQEVFDSYSSSASASTWYRDWAARVLTVRAEDPGINSAYRESVRALTAAGVLTEHALTGGRTAWGLNSEHLLIDREVSVARCGSCGREVVLPRGQAQEWLERSCLHYRCSGTYQLGDEAVDSYYSQLFRSGRVERIFAAEHTGLLTRENRERLEERFKSQSAPDAENLLVATPTLEMGIDIGDLSALVLCSVPPTVSSYLQRIGRAGRKTGNATCVTLANSSPHDLYFHAEPLEMLAGEVLPPGCFLNAPEMLRRQMAAHAMDAWAREDLGAISIPFRTSMVLSPAGSKVFPGRFLDFYKEHRERLTNAFLEKFGAQLSAGNAETLNSFGMGDSVQELITAAFDRIRAEKQDLRAIVNRARDRQKNIEDGQEEVEDADSEIHDLKRSQSVVLRLMEELDAKYPLNVLTDEGILPNYAFPESGVSLDSVLREVRDDGDTKYETREFVRPASSAIRELAPFNTFYAEGRAVRIDEIDVGSTARPLVEKWRLCAECNHLEREMDNSQPASACPRCGDSQWADSGQLRTLIHFRRSRSLAGRLDAAAVDESDDREEEHYSTFDLIDVGPENWHGARLIADLPFGYELLRDLKLRELNVGPERQAGGQGLRIAGKAVGDNGFMTCLDCGRVQEKNAQKPNHAPYCKARKTASVQRVESIFLYRELESEGIRILLPVSEVELDQSRASFKAALELGFRRHFQGEPGHLQIKYLREPVAGGGHRQYLVIFDSVPGGTGYLSELSREDVFLDVLSKSLEALQACRCQQDPSKDGCYRCLYAYQRQKELHLVSSKRAQRFLKAILDRRDQFVSVPTLSEVSLDRRLESELEEKFVRALADYVRGLDAGEWEEAVKKGEVYWKFTLAGRKWEMQTQKPVGHAQGVLISSRPDFLIRPASHDPNIRSIAVFCDGLAYHALPGEPEGRIWDDLQKRTSILNSGRYWCWSVTWKDVESFQTRVGDRQFGGIFEGLNGSRLGHIATALNLNIDRTVGKVGSLGLLTEYLGRPEDVEWRKLAQTFASTWLVSETFLTPVEVAALTEGLETHPDQNAPAALERLAKPGDPVARLSWGEYLAVLGRLSKAQLSEKQFSEVQVLLRLFDSQHAREGKEFESDWRRFLHAWNLLQFVDHTTVVSSELIQAYNRTSAEVPVLRVADSDDSNYDVSMASVDQDVEPVIDAARPILDALVRSGVHKPTVAFELGEDERCGPTAELAWPEAKVALLFGNQTIDDEVFRRNGWTTFVEPVDVEAVLAALTGGQASDHQETA